MSNTQGNEKGSLADSFRDLSGSQKLGAFAALAVLLFLVFMLVSSLFSNNDDQGSEQPDGPTSASYAPDPISSATSEPSLQPDSSAIPEPGESEIDEESLPAFEGEELPDLSSAEPLPVVEQREAVDFAQSGIDEFLDWAPDEPLSERVKRIEKFFASDSALINKSPTVSDDAREYSDPESGRPQFAYMGEVTSVVPGNGNADRYRASFGITLRTQMYDPLTTEPGSPVDESTDTYTVDMTKSDGSWKIISIIVE